MTLPVSTLIKPKGNAAPPESIKKLFQSGAISQEQVDMFFLWIDKLIKTGTTEELREKKVRSFLYLACKHCAPAAAGVYQQVLLPHKAAVWRSGHYIVCAWSWRARSAPQCIVLMRDERL